MDPILKKIFYEDLSKDYSVEELNALSDIELFETELVYLLDILRQED